MMANMNKSAITLYGIRNCDTVKKAREWMTGQGVEYQFHDFKLLGVPVPQIDRWLATVGWERLLNRQGPTWRKLDEATRASVVDAQGARAVMLANPSVIKRPVVEWGNTASSPVTVGFKPDLWSGQQTKIPAPAHPHGAAQHADKYSNP